MTHQLRERRQAHSGAYHIRGKSVSKTMRMGELNPGGFTMVAEQRTQSRSVHACSACAPFQNDKQRGTAGAWTFELQIVIEQLNSFRRQGKKAKIVAFARNTNLWFGKQQIVVIQGQYFGGAESMQEHQSHNR